MHGNAIDSKGFFAVRLANIARRMAKVASLPCAKYVLSKKISNLTTPLSTPVAQKSNTVFFLFEL
jgi:hypothetical protein